jgi:hypothetical protein
MRSVTLAPSSAQTNNPLASGLWSLEAAGALEEPDAYMSEKKTPAAQLNCAGQFGCSLR